MSGHLLVIAVWVLLIAGGVGLGAAFGRSRSSGPRHRPDGEDGLDVHFSAYWWM